MGKKLGRSKITVKVEKDLTGLKFGRLTVLEQGEDFNFWDKSRKSPRIAARWLCICECKKTTLLRTYSLKSGKTKSCGCLREERNSNGNYKHGCEVYSAYSSWYHMIQRCKNSLDKGFKHYGARGIDVDPRWLDVRNFIEDMGERPKGTSLDRIDNNKGYSKNNCRWAAHKDQARNKRSSVFITFKGETLTKAGWAEKLGITIDCLKYRLNKKWPLEEALTARSFAGNNHRRKKRKF